MKFVRSFGYGVFAVTLTAVAASQAFAGAIQLSFDEAGDGSWQDTTSASQNGYTGTSGSLSSFLGSDPYCVSNAGSCVGGNVLIFKLPELVISGPVDIGEPGDTVGVADASPSDVLFFTNSDGVNDGGLDANWMVFYSLADDPDGEAAADTGLPSNAGTFIDKADETASDTFQWLPDGPTYPNGNEYDGVSGAPEPTSMALLGAGLLGLGFIARKRRSA